jgi:hypothetical protein
MAPTHRAIPTLARLSVMEARAIESMFRLYDTKATGRIPQHLCHKLCKALGFDFSIHSLPLNGSLKEILLFLDMRVVEPEPVLFAQMQSFTHLVARKVDLTKHNASKVIEDGEEGEGSGVEDTGAKSGDGHETPRGNGGNGGGEGDGDDGSVGTEGTPTGNRTETKEKYITTAAINAFVVSLGRPPLNTEQCELLLTSMLERDDCGERTGGQAGVLPEFFERDFTLFAKKSNALKNFK